MKISKLFRKEIFHRNSTRWLLVVNLAGWMALFIYTLINVRPRSFAISARFSTLHEFIQLSQWYWHLLPAIFLLLAGAVNVWLAQTLLAAKESVELQRMATKILAFQFILTVLTFTVAFHLIKTATI